MVSCLTFEVSDGFKLGLACFLVVFVVFDALSKTRSAIDGRSSIVLENDAAATIVNKKNITFMFSQAFKFKVFISSIYKPCGLSHAYI